MDYVTRKIFPKIKADIAAHGANTLLDFVDNIEAVEQTTLKVNDILLNAQDAAVSIDLKINEDKMNYMVVSKRKRQRIRQSIIINDHNVEVVKEFNYLGAIITNDKKAELEVEMRILAGNKSVLTIQHLTRSNFLTSGAKIKIDKMTCSYVRKQHNMYTC